MISERQQEAASLYVLGALTAAEKESFEGSLRAEPELRELVGSLEQTAGLLARAIPPVAPPRGLRDRILRRVEAEESRPLSAAPAFPVDPAFFFVAAHDASGWKALPVPGAFIKLLSADRERGYAVLLGRLQRGVRYPAHAHDTAEDILLLSGDLTIAGRRLGPGDFHHCDAGTSHPVNFSDEGCTLLAVLSVDHDLAKFAMA
jgi:anti-sigma factor ChrR (cupin superfamily)